VGCLDAEYRGFRVRRGRSDNEHLVDDDIDDQQHILYGEHVFIHDINSQYDEFHDLDCKFYIVDHIYDKFVYDVFDGIYHKFDYQFNVVYRLYIVDEYIDFLVHNVDSQFHEHDVFDGFHQFDNNFDGIYDLYYDEFHDVDDVQHGLHQFYIDQYVIYRFYEFYGLDDVIHNQYFIDGLDLVNVIFYNQYGLHLFDDVLYREHIFNDVVDLYYLQYGVHEFHDLIEFVYDQHVDYEQFDVDYDYCPARRSDAVRYQIVRILHWFNPVRDSLYAR
jgi:hypothetical protein